MYSRALVFMILSSFSALLAAEGLYLQTLKQTEPTEEQLQKSLKTVDEYKKIERRGELEVPPFHKRTAEDDSLGNSFCTTCHLSPPHTKSVRSRTFMNMHTQYIACETCHFRPENVPLNYQWQDTRDGSVVAASTGLFRQTIKLDKKDKAAILAAEKPKNTFLKITPYYQQQAVNLRKDSEFSKQTKAIWQQAKKTPEKVERRALIHAPLTEKGPNCQACHIDKEALLDLAILGADKYQAAKIQNNIVTQFFGRYKEEDQKIRIIDLLK
ncbi:MAG: hypothetical protein GQ582_13400 [Methyloprofundus sp.]|nr:hypothetical protein [Methyloprofundus sp.]